MSKILVGLEGVQPVVYGKDLEEHNIRLEAVLKRITTRYSQQHQPARGSRIIMCVRQLSQTCQPVNIASKHINMNRHLTQSAQNYSATAETDGYSATAETDGPRKAKLT